jgi:hypothetical protein
VTLSITTLSIRQSIVILTVTLSVIYKPLCAECRYAECHYAECRYAECRYAECRYAECRYAECRSAVVFTTFRFLPYLQMGQIS